MDLIEKTINCNAKKFLIIVFSIQFALIGLIALDFLNLSVPILRQVIGFIYLIFIPGAVIHRVFKLNKLTPLESCMCIIGLSILFLMFTGFLMNNFSHFYASKPISLIPIISTIFTIVSVLSFLCYFRDKNTSNEIYFNKNYTLSPTILFLCIIPILSIIGSYILNFYHTNLLTLLNIILICIILLLIIFTDFLPKHLYPFAIFVIAISILYHNSLASTYLDGWDIHYEYHYANSVLTDFSWNSKIPSNINGMLSIVILAPIYSTVCNLELTYTFKIIYPFLFSMLPVAIYQIYQKQINNEKIAFLSVFYFLSIYTFFTEMLALARQQIGELFFILIFLIMLSDLESFKKKTLIVLFILGLITSHYGLSYLVLLFMPLAYLFMMYVLKHKSNTFTVNFILLFSVFTLLWYINLTNGSIFEIIINIFNQIYKVFIKESFSTESFELATNKSVFLSGQILRLLYLISQLFIVIGFIKVLIKSKDYRTSNEYLSFSLMLLCILISSILTSYTGMNIHRLYHITSIFLSLFCIIGGITVFQLIFVLFTKRATIKFSEKSLKILAVFLIIFMIFNIGVGQQIINDNPTSISLNREWMESSNNIESKYILYKMHFPSQDVVGTKWISKNRNSQTKIYADFSSTELLFFSYGMMNRETVLTNDTKIEPNSYIYLRYPSTHYGLMYGPEQGMKWDISGMIPMLNQKNLIYSSHDNFVYKL